MVFRSSNLKKNLLWKTVDTETNEGYRSGIQELLDDDWTILALVAWKTRTIETISKWFN